MKILLLIKNFDFGGAENHVRELANSLDASGYEVFVAARYGRQVNLLSENVHYTRLGIIHALSIVQIAFLVYFIMRNRIRIIHAHQRLPILVASVAGKIAGIPVVATVHGRTRFDLRSWISRSFPSKIIFVSRHVLEVSSKYDRIVNRSVVIPNWISVPGEQKQKNPLSISYVSRMDKKHSDLILMIIKDVLGPIAVKYPELTLRIIGEGDYLDHIRIEAEILNRSLNREVCITCGFVIDPREMLKTSELVLGVGRVALEALSCGIPVLSMNRQRMGTLISRENYEDYRNTNFVAAGMRPPDINTLKTELEKFLSNTGYWKDESAVIMEKVNRDYNASDITMKICNLYNSLIRK